MPDMPTQFRYERSQAAETVTVPIAFWGWLHAALESVPHDPATCTGNHIDVDCLGCTAAHLIEHMNEIHDPAARQPVRPCADCSDRDTDDHDPHGACFYCGPPEWGHRDRAQQIMHSLPVGWQCPRCGRVNAPWAMQCTCAAVTAPDQWPGEPNKWPTYTGDPLPGQELTTICSAEGKP